MSTSPLGLKLLSGIEGWLLRPEHCFLSHRLPPAVFQQAGPYLSTYLPLFVPRMIKLPQKSPSANTLEGKGRVSA